MNSLDTLNEYLHYGTNELVFENVEQKVGEELNDPTFFAFL